MLELILFGFGNDNLYSKLISFKSCFFFVLFMKKQLTIFPEPELSYYNPFNHQKGEPEAKEVKQKLEIIEGRTVMTDFIETERRADLYLVQYNKKIIGGAYIWDGWNPRLCFHFFPNPLL